MEVRHQEVQNTKCVWFIESSVQDTDKGMSLSK